MKELLVDYTENYDEDRKDHKNHYHQYNFNFVEEGAERSIATVQGGEVEKCRRRRQRRGVSGGQMIDSVSCGKKSRKGK